MLDDFEAEIEESSDLMIYEKNISYNLPDSPYYRYQNLPEFQFNYCTIKRKMNTLRAISFRHFNSTIVRLKEKKEESSYRQLTYFNSTIVRLKECVVGIV